MGRRSTALPQGPASERRLSPECRCQLSSLSLVVMSAEKSRGVEAAAT